MNLRGDGADQLFGRITSPVGTAPAKAHWYMTDRLGSVIGISTADGMGAVKWVRYAGFEVQPVCACATLDDRFQFTGKPFDHQSGLQLNGIRPYDPLTGRFLTEDPAGLGAETNPYRYAGNSPSNATDPSGRLILLAALAPVGIYLGKVLIESVVETGIEAGIAEATGDEEFHFGKALARNAGVNTLTGWIPGAVEAKIATKAAVKLSTKLGTKLAVEGTEFAATTGADTAWEVGVNGRDLDDALLQSAVGNAGGKLLGPAAKVLGRGGKRVGRWLGDNYEWNPGFVKGTRLLSIGGDVPSPIRSRHVGPEAPKGPHNDGGSDAVTGNGGTAPENVGEAVAQPREIARRFDSKKNIKQARKKGIIYDPEKGNGIPTTSTDIEPVNPDSIREMTGARSAEEYIDIDITGKQVIRRNTKAGHKETVVQEDIKPDDIVGSGRVRRSRLSDED